MTTDYIAIAQERVANEYPLIIYAKPQLSDLPTGAILGTWAYSVPGVARFILAKQNELATGVLPADVTRAWVRDSWKLPLRRRENQLGKPYALPLHAVRGSHGLCAYVDIRRAYLTILSIGYDVEYVRGRYIGGEPKAVPEQIAGNKFCYSIAVAMAASKRSHITVVGKEGVFDRHTYNMFSNPCLYALAGDTLNSIASEVLAVMGQHVKYVNTDGYIVPLDKVEPLLKIIRSWGFDARVKHQGETTVYGVASWQVGDERTFRRDPNGQDFTSPMATPQERRWLKARWQRWVEVIAGL
jgi:hypothetical protein